MESTEIDALQTWSTQRVSRVSTAFKRYLWEQINWNNQLNIVVGARGVGKTTLLLQYLKERFPLKPKILIFRFQQKTLDNFCCILK